jgi:pilus assembly protein CpaB
MNKHAVIPLAIGLLVGIFALKLGYDYLSKMKNQAGPNFGPMIQVVVAGKNIPLGTKLTDKDVVLMTMPKKLAPEGTYTELKEVVGQSIRVSLTAKLPILKDMIGPGEGLEGIIPVGYRAVSVKVDEFTSVAGLLRPGVKVDVLGTFNFRSTNGGTETISKVVLQNVEVRAVGQEYRSENMENVSAKVTPSRSVTLLVKSEDAESLQLAASSGTIRLALRSATEQESSAETKGVTMSQLLRLGNGDQMLTAKSNSSFKDLFSFMTNAPAQAPASKKQVKKDKPFAVEVIKGNTSERIYFASANSDIRVNPQAKDEESLKEKKTAKTTKMDLVAVPE